MREALLALTLSLCVASVANAQSNAAPTAGETKHAQSPATGKAKETPSTTPIPGPSSTGNQTTPAAKSAASTAPGDPVAKQNQ
jgi:hypothetical protein